MAATFKALEKPVVNEPCKLLVWTKHPHTGNWIQVKASTTPVKEFWTIGPGEYAIRTAESYMHVRV